ncbi:MAG: glycosyltransferase family 39 protein [Chloroflexi bacterium]|nr:glycosyltransferase family 39 protein [Chloroflexota bacterium]
MKADWRKLVLIVIVVAWTFAVVFGYYVVHKPFTTANVLAIASSIGDVLTALALYALAAVLGRKALRSFGFQSPLEEIVFQIGLGLAVVSFVTLALGLIGWLHPLFLWAIVLLALVTLRKDLRVVWRTLRSIQLSCSTRFERWLAGGIGFVLIVTFLFGLTPPLGWDGLQYHLVGPKLALQAGRILPPPDNPSLSFPGLVEMLFLAAMGLKSDSAAQLMHWGYLPLLLGAVMALAQRHFSSRVGWLALALLVTVPSLMSVSTLAYNDVALAFYTLTALMLAWRANSSKQLGDFALAGIFAGLAMGEKYTAVFVPLVLLVLIFRLDGRAIVAMIVFGVSAAVVASPWLIRNWIFVGNPVYPFVWGGVNWDSFRAEWYSRFGTGMMNEPLRLLIAPWEATVVGSEQATLYQATIGPLLLTLIPLSLLVRAPAAAITRWLWICAGLMYLVWLVGVAQSALLWQTRLLFFAFPIFALLAALGFEQLEQLTLPQFSIQRFVTLVMSLVIGLSLFSYGLALIQSNPFRFLVGVQSREQYLASALGEYYSVAEFVNHQLPSDARVLFLWETRPYYFNCSVLEDAQLDRWPHLRWRYHNIDAIVGYVRHEKYTHILLYRSGLDQVFQAGIDPVMREDAFALQDFLDRYAHQIYGKSALEIVTLDSKPSVANVSGDAYAVYEVSRSQGQ